MAKRSKKALDWKKQMQDSKGIKRTNWKHSMDPNLFILLKLGCIILIPIIYFVYSPLLILVLLAYASFFFLTIMAERKLNKSVIKKNHITIPKFDSAIALVIVIIATVGIFFANNSNQKRSTFASLPETQIEEFSDKPDFKLAKKSTFWITVKQTLTNLGSCLTGTRSVFGESVHEFGSMQPPEDFVSDSSELQEEIHNMPNPSQDFDFDISDLPVEYMFSNILSTVNSALIFLVTGLGLTSLVFVVIKRHKFETAMNEVIIEDEITMLTDAEIDKILSFGEDYEESNPNNNHKK